MRPGPLPTSSPGMPRKAPHGPDASSAGVPERLAQSWPPSVWQDVHALVAVSGGGDSMALLRALHALRPPAARGRLIAAHVNHRLRGAAADADEAWLAEQTARLGIELLVARRGATRLRVRRQGLEAAARDFRYQQLARLAAEAGARYVVLGHTRDDQIETILFRLLRGTGLRGLTGMPMHRPLAEHLTLVRPLLGLSGELLRDFLRGLGQSYREDRSNANLRFRRNWLRRRLLPALRTHVGGDVDQAVLRLASQAVAAQRIVAGAADALWGLLDVRRTASPAGGGGVTDLAVAPLQTADPYLVCEVLRRIWREAGWPEQRMAARHWQQLAALAVQASGTLEFPGRVSATRRGLRLELRELS